MEQVKVEVRLEEKDMRYFLFRHTYASPNGVLGLCISAAAVVLLAVNFRIYSGLYLGLLGIVALMYTVIQPIQLCLRAKKQMKAEMFQKPLEYTFEEKGITVRQEEQELALTWNQIAKVIHTKHGLIFYLDRMRGYVLPKEEMGEKEEEILAICKKYFQGKIK